MSKTEAQTRAELIDKQLAQSGWNVKDSIQAVEIFKDAKRGWDVYLIDMLRFALNGPK